MAKLGRGTWSVDNDRATVTVELAGSYTVDLIATRDGKGPPIVLPAFQGGLAEATIRGPEDPGDASHPGLYPWRPTLALEWRSPAQATASDAGLLASDRRMRRVARL